MKELREHVTETAAPKLKYNGANREVKWTSRDRPRPLQQLWKDLEEGV